MAEKDELEKQRDRTSRLIEQQNKYKSEGALLGGTRSRQRKEGTGPHPRYNKPLEESTPKK